MLEGYISREVNLEYKHPANISSKAENKLYLGHAVHTLGGATGNNSWQMGNVMVFKGRQHSEHMPPASPQRGMRILMLSFLYRNKF